MVKEKKQASAKVNETSKLQESKILDSYQNSKRILKSRDFDGDQKSKISDKKTKTIDEIVDLIKKSNSVIIVSIKNLPSSQFQAIKKKLRENAVIKVTKKSVMERVIDKIEKGTIKNMKKHLREDLAYIFSKLNPFELSAILSRNKTKARAKIGQIVEEEVVIEPGPTELVPGPVISELSNLGLKFAIEDGKISIKERKAILKAGDKVSEQAASIMAKLDMKPVSVGLEPVIAYDAREDKIYENIKIDTEKTIDELKKLAAKALAFAVKIAYPCKDTIKLLLAKAFMQEKALEKLIKTDAQPKQEQNIQGGQ